MKHEISVSSMKSIGWRNLVCRSSYSHDIITIFSQAKLCKYLSTFNIFLFIWLHWIWYNFEQSNEVEKRSILKRTTERLIAGPRSPRGPSTSRPSSPSRRQGADPGVREGPWPLWTLWLGRLRSLPVDTLCLSLYFRSWTYTHTTTSRGCESCGDLCPDVMMSISNACAKRSRRAIDRNLCLLNCNYSAVNE